MTFLIDIDDTILVSDKTECSCCGRVSYSLKEIDTKEIKRINAAYAAGHTVLMYTGRNWDCYRQTKQQLESVGVKYHELVMGKPSGIYVDKDSVRSIGEVLS